MASAAENTKIELVTEAFEQLAIAIAQGIAFTVKHKINPTTPELIGVAITDARAEVRSALAELLKPTLRVISQTPAEPEKPAVSRKARNRFA